MAEKLDADLVMQSMLLDELGKSVIGVDADWRITYWNRASEPLYGFNAAQVIGAKIGHLRIRAVVPLIRRRGRSRSGSPTAEPGHANSGSTTGRTGVAHYSGGRCGHFKEITDRKHDEAVLRRFLSLVESSGDAIVSADMSGTITSWNPGAARMFGWTAREATGKTTGH